MSTNEHSQVITDYIELDFPFVAFIFVNCRIFSTKVGENFSEDVDGSVGNLVKLVFGQLSWLPGK